MTVTEPCVSLSTGTLSPDKRVNYVHGMVLGLGEFLQEQQYVLQKGYLRQRSLVGYGTAYGLEVSVAPTADVAGDVTVMVGPGMGIDQAGREFVITSAQCARLGAWLGVQERATPGIIAQHLGPSGELRVYVVASYASCLDDLVPLPGQPCSSSERTKAASRIRDAWDIELVWERPPMPRWDTDRRIARLLDSVEVVAGLDPALSSEPELLEIIRHLPDVVPQGPDRLSPPDWPPVDASNPSGPTPFRLPADEAADAVDRLLTAWVTRVRPQLDPAFGLTAEAAVPAVLLSTLTCTIGVSSPPAGGDPEILDCPPPDDEGRPYLLHTQLIQELAALDNESTRVRERVVELATVTGAVDPSGQLVLTVWFRLDRPVSLTGLVRVDSREGESGWFVAAPPADPSGAAPPTGFSDVWVLTPTAPFAAVDGDQVALTFEPDTVLVGDPLVTLADRLLGELTLLDTTPLGDVVVYGTVEVPQALPPVVVPPEPPVVEVRERPAYVFVTTTVLTYIQEPDSTVLECWFHPQPRWPQPRVVVTELPPEPIRLVDERTGDERKAVATEQVAPNVWQVFFQLKGEQTSFGRLLLPTDPVVVQLDDLDRLSLTEWIEKAELSFLNPDPDNKALVDYVRLERKLQ